MFRILLFLGLIVLVFGQGSWQQYVDDNLTGEGLAKAAIIGLDGSVWAISAGFSLKAGEGKALASLFETGKAFATGITLSGIKYLAIKSNEQSIYGKKGTGGVVAVKTVQAIIIGVYGDKIQPGRAYLIVEKLGDYLREQGY